MPYLVSWTFRRLPSGSFEVASLDDVPKGMARVLSSLDFRPSMERRSILLHGR
jgi:hypothetical protein